MRHAAGGGALGRERRRWSTLLLLFASSCASSPSGPSSPRASRIAANDAGSPAPFVAGSPEPAAKGDAQQRVATFLRRVAAARHLSARTDVAARELDRGALIASVREHVAREVPPEVIRGQGELLVSLGLIAPDFDYEEGTFRLLESQLAGFYEPHDKKMYLAADLEDSAADATLSHELVHALQDQYYDLGSKLSYSPEANDRSSALQGLAEGDATSAMMDLMLAPSEHKAVDIPDDLFAADVEKSMAASPETAAAPRVLQSSLVAPYVDGVLFVHALRRRGMARSGVEGGGWAAVDEAWRSPPQTTEQLLHLDKYDAREPAEPIAVPSPPPFGSWSSVYDDVFGEEGLRIAIEEWLPRKAAANAAEGWAGDRVTVFRGSEATPVGGSAAPGATNAGRSTATAWHIRFDPSASVADARARRTFQALATALKARQSAASTTACIERRGLGPLALARAGRDLAVVAGPYQRDGNRVAADSACAKSIRWAAAIVAPSKS